MEGNTELIPRSSTSITLLVLALLNLTILTTKAQTPTYVGDDCNTTTEQPLTIAYQTNLDNILSWLSSNAETSKGYNHTTINTGTAANNTVYGLYDCRGDVDKSFCKFCVSTVSREMQTRCPNRVSAVMWYDYCTLRYSNQNFIGNLSLSPLWDDLGSKNITNPEEVNATENYIRSLIRTATEETNQLYAMGEFYLSNGERRYGMVQCSRDLSNEKCGQCLKAMVETVPRCCAQKLGWQVLVPSCLIRYEDYAFYSTYNQTTSSSMPDSPTAKQGGTSRSRTLVISIISALVALALLSCSTYYFLCRNKVTKEGLLSETTLADLQGNVESENSYEDLYAIPFITIQHSTNNFSEASKLGEGGFGPVYKGILPDGREIAVKRLSKTSGQGLEEFKNEVIFIAKLQHKNLVRLFGCCIERNEKLLVYEYMPNSSLDSHLFDMEKRKQLDWKLRLNIINGIARGLLYLHEDSRLKVIHRDLKTSNVLLDYEMIPKISDFGMARKFEGGQHQEITIRVMGTFGYMAPEYAMQGLFSVKSDVFSFGVILLEIICGQRNNGLFVSKYGQGLLIYIWKLWGAGKSLELMDPTLEKSCIADEVTRCVQIGLLCVQEDAADRPTMSDIVIMLASDTVSLPHPNHPAFSVGRMVKEESGSRNSFLSINEITVSHISAR